MVERVVDNAFGSRSAQVVLANITRQFSLRLNGTRLGNLKSDPHPAFTLSRWRHGFNLRWHCQMRVIASLLRDARCIPATNSRWSGVDDSVQRRIHRPPREQCLSNCGERACQGSEYRYFVIHVVGDSA
jgi:hypothetical protein